MFFILNPFLSVTFTYLLDFRGVKSLSKISVPVMDTCSREEIPLNEVIGAQFSIIRVFRDTAFFINEDVINEQLP